MGMKVKALLMALSWAFIFGAGWVSQGWRLSGQIESLKHGQTQAKLSNVTAAAAELAETHEGFVDALQQFQSAQQANRLAQQDLGRVLLDLRGFASGLRGDFAGLPGRIERASQAASAEYIAACTAVFEDLAREIGALAEHGATIAEKADGHAADVQLMQGAWPK